jgi:hypothetical protein
MICRAGEREAMVPFQIARELMQALIGEGTARRGQPGSEHQDIH